MLQDSRFLDRVTTLERHLHDPADEDRLIDVICECSAVHCVETVLMPASAFAAVSRYSDRLVVCPGHRLTNHDPVLERAAGYWIIRACALEAHAELDPAPERPADELLSVLRSAVRERMDGGSSTTELDAHRRELKRHATLARNTARAYRHATHQYHDLMRHRIANPLAVISGMAETLRHNDLLDRTCVEPMLDAIIEQSRRLAAVAVEPHALDDVERLVEPWPARTERRLMAVGVGHA